MNFGLKSSVTESIGLGLAYPCVILQATSYMSAELQYLLVLGSIPNGADPIMYMYAFYRILIITHSYTH